MTLFTKYIILNTSNLLLFYLSKNYIKMPEEEKKGKLDLYKILTII